MKNKIIVIAILTIGFLLTGCAQNNGVINHASEQTDYGKYPITYVFDNSQFVSIIEGEALPVEIRHGLGGEGGYEQWSSRDSEMISRYIDVLRGLEIKREITDENEFVYVADGINDYIFYLEDGTEILISMDLNAYVKKGDKQYEFKYSDDLNALNKKLSLSDEPSSESSELSADTDNIATDKTINVVWSHTYYWAMGSDYVYVDSDGKIYEEHEMEEPMFRPSGACNETYTGKQFTEEELNEFLSVNKEEEDRQKEVLSRMGIKFGK